MATQANQMSWNTNSPAALGDTNYWQTGDIVLNNNQVAIPASTTATGTSGTNTLTVASATGIVSGEPVIAINSTAIPANTIVVSVSGTTVTISQNLTAALSSYPVQFLGNNYLVPYGWVCVQNGFPGVWEPICQEPTAVCLTTQTLGTLSSFFRVTLLNPATTGPYSLPEAVNNFAGSIITIKNLASGSVTLTPLGTDSYADAAAITLAQYAKISLLSNGTTTWYSV